MTVRSAFLRLWPGLVHAGLLWLLMASGPVLAQVTAPGTPISNAAQATFVRGAATDSTATSNTVVTIVAPAETRATLQLLRVGGSIGAAGVGEPAGPTQCVRPSGTQLLANPVLIGGAAIDPAQPRQFTATASYHGGEPVFVRITDPDQNRDALVRDTIDVELRSPQSGDLEIVRLTETQVASGIFVGYLQTSAAAPAPRDCALQVARDATIESRYVDVDDATDVAQAQALIDPTGVVFDSRTGQPVNGARIRIVEEATGNAARVLGDDGVSVYPSEIVTGAQATDSGGTVYAFAPGAFRFPVVAGGDYRFEVVPPASHTFPSSAPPPQLQGLPGAPYLLATGSFGAAFAVSAPAEANFDVPLDPAAGILFLQKSTATTIASVGDFIQYALRLENTSSAAPLLATRIEDTLPGGLRYRRGTTRLVLAAGTQVAADPAVSGDGRTLTFTVGELQPGEVVTLRYVAEVTAAARGETLVNRARASDVSGLVSNEAVATLQLRNELDRERGFIVGRVTDGGCEAHAAQGVAGVRIYLEDGRYSLTDREGKYHFEDVPAGTHVVQLDRDTVPDTLEPVLCERRVRNAGRAHSQFVDLAGGALRRADFALQTRKPPQGSVSMDIQAVRNAPGSALTAMITVDAVAVGNARLLIMLPPAVEHVPDADLPDAGRVAVTGSVLSVQLGELAAGSQAPVWLPLRSRTAGEPSGIARAVLMFDSPTQSGQKLPPTEVNLGITTPAPLRTNAVTHGVLAMIRAPRAGAVVGEPAPRSDASPLPNVESLAAGVDWLLPVPEYNPAITSIKVALRHLPEQKILLSINGTPVSPLNFYGTSVNKARTAALSAWRGVDIPVGTSELQAVVLNGEGAEVTRLTRKLNYSGGAVRGELLAERSELLADGRTRPVVRLRLTDAQGQPARPGTVGAFRVDPPHRSWFEVRALTDNQLVATGEREPTYVVDDDGIAALELEPTSQSGQVVLRLRFAEGREQEVRAWLKPAARDWILVGLVEGTAAHRTLSQNMEAAEDAGLEEGFSEDGRVAFFAKGRIRGDFLLTAAYDSARERREARGRLNDVIEPQRYYTLYGDATEQRNEAASQRKLYLKLEREQFYALFGDFDTGLTVTELSRYSRTLNGVHSEYVSGRWGMNVFAARTDQNAVRDELRGDGTSGLYRLSRRPLIIGSDKVRLEVRDRFRSERIVEGRELARFLDYSIDYTQGTLFFKQPVPSRDGEFNPVYLIVEYETQSASAEDTTAGGRASVQLGAVELGASVIHEGAQAGDRDLAGVDLRWAIGAATELRTEIARSDSDAGGAADAYLAELAHVSARLDGRAYVREQQARFGLGQQLSTETGTRKVGFDGRVVLTEHLAVQAEAYRQEQLSDAAQRELASLELRYEDERKGAGAGVGVRHVSDDVRGETLESQQAFAQASVDLFAERLRLRASSDFELSSSSQSIDFPARSVLGADWRLTPDTTLFGEYEHADGARIASDMTRIGVKSSPWNRAQVQSSVSQEQGEYGPRTFANLGLTQGFQLNDRWALDVGLDQSNTLRGAGAQPVNPNVPLASGSLDSAQPGSSVRADDFLAAFAGALYRSELWTFTSRAEYRSSDIEERAILTGGFYREPVAGHAFSLATSAISSDFTSGAESLALDVRLGWAYRPVDSRWILLDRLDLVYETLEDPFTDQNSSRIVNRFNANWQANEATEVALHYGARYVRTTFDRDTFSGYSDLLGVELRRDLNQRFDVGLSAGALNGWSSGTHDYTVGVDLGVSFARNLWISIGYNFAGFHDEDFSRNRYTGQGPFIKLRLKADQDTLKDLGL